MVSLDTPIELDFRRFFNWWRRELAFLVPSWLRKMVTDSYDCLIVSRQGDYFELKFLSDDPRKEFGRIILNEEGRQVWYRLVSRNVNLQNAPIVLRLVAGQALQKIITLPAAAQDNMLQVVGFEMERLTPFKADQVYYDARLVEKLPKLNQIRVELVVVQRARLDAILREMVGLGLLPGRVDVITDTEKENSRPSLHYNLLPEKLHERPDRRKRIINGSLLVLLLVLVSLIAVVPLWVKRSYMLELEAQVDRTRKAGMEVKALKKEAEALSREANFLLEKKSTEPVLVEMLNELSRVIPDETWLTDINYRENKLQIHGQSPSASALIELIEASPFFESVSFVSPVNQDRNTGLERFQIATQVVGSSDREESTDAGAIGELPGE